MTKQKPVLGRGLASLIQRHTTVPVEPLPRPDDGVSTQTIATIEIARIEPNPYQPRADFAPAGLDELSRSIREKGIIQPITVRRHGGNYQLISGERRVRAARDAGLVSVPAYIIRVGTDEEMLELALIENLQREELNPMEVAISYRRLIEECSYTQEELAGRIGKDRATVANMLRLLKLPDVIQAALRSGELTSGHARTLVAIPDEKMQIRLYQRIVRDGLSVREAERLAREHPRPTRHKGPVPRTGTQGALTSVEDRLRTILGTKVQVRQLRNGKGEILIQYYSADDLDRLLDLFEELPSSRRT
jgi:ParB family chromosome partitioning protein